MWKQWHCITWLGAKGHDWTEHSMKWHHGIASHNELYMHMISPNKHLFIPFTGHHVKLQLVRSKEISCRPQPSLWVPLWWCRALAVRVRFKIIQSSICSSTTRQDFVEKESGHEKSSCTRRKVRLLKIADPSAQISILQLGFPAPNHSAEGCASGQWKSPTDGAFLLFLAER